MKQFIVDGGWNTRELPNLPILESDFENVCMLAVGERFDFGIEYGNMRNFKRRDEVLAVVELAVAFAAEDHELEHTGQMFGVATDP